jgi:hypothetical protein
VNGLDPERVLRALDTAGVQYILIGGFATNIHGYERATVDLAICYERSRANVERLAGVLRQLAARPRQWPMGVPFVLDAQTILNGDSFTFDTIAGPLDVLATPSGSAGYSDLQRGSQTVELGEHLLVQVVGLQDLIRLKRAAGRGKDLVDVAAPRRPSRCETSHPAE